jgi:hypothetical protein
MLIASGLRAGGDLLLKQSLLSQAVQVGAFWISRLGLLVGAVGLLTSRAPRARVAAGLPSVPPPGVVLVIANEIVALVSFHLMALALRSGPLGLVTAVSSNVAVFTLLYGTTAALIWRSSNLGSARPRVVLTRLLLIGLIGCGTLLLGLPSQ